MTGGDQPISWLMFVTFGAAIFAIAGACIWHLRSRSSRAIAADALAGSHGGTPSAAPEGALPELLAVSFFAFIAMGLLAGGYYGKTSSEKAPKPPLVGGQMPAPPK